MYHSLPSLLIIFTSISFVLFVQEKFPWWQWELQLIPAFLHGHLLVEHVLDFEQWHFTSLLLDRAASLRLKAVLIAFKSEIHWKSGIPSYGFSSLPENRVVKTPCSHLHNNNDALYNLKVTIASNVSSKNETN